MEEKNFFSGVNRRSERLRICAACPHMREIIGVKQCKLCGCFVAIKVMLDDETCKDGRW
jgi:hypothetical protein